MLYQKVCPKKQTFFYATNLTSQGVSMPIKTLCPNCHSSNVYKLGNDNINFSLPLNQTLLHPKIIEGLSTSICNAYRLPPYAGIAISTVANIAISLVQTKFTIFPGSQQIQCIDCEYVFDATTLNGT